MGKLPIQLSVIGLLVVLAAWLMSASDPETQAVEPQGEDSGGSLSVVSGSLQASTISDTKPADNRVERISLGKPESLDLEARFNSANQAVQRGESTEATEKFIALTRDYPNFVEPYVNLAALQAGQGELEQARATLKKASAANPSTKVLFDSISQVHGALAAKAYRHALETEASVEVAVSLPKATELATDFSQAEKIRTLNLLLEKQRSSVVAQNGDATELKKQVEQLRGELIEAKSNHQNTVAEQQLAVSSLTEKFNRELEQSGLLRAQLAQLQASRAKVDSDVLAKLRIELVNSESALRFSQSKVEELTLLNDDLSKRVALAQTSAEPIVASSGETKDGMDSIPEPDSTPTSAIVLTEEQKAIAIELVRGWANAWSAQDVQRYVGFYEAGYSSSANLTHEQWLDQRQIRLTNKRFIEVKATNFSVDAQNSADGEGFGVTFTQRYQSNTLDDTIRKQLSFSIPPGGDWSKAKVVSERIVKR